MRHLLTREYVLSKFEKCRATPGAPFEESHFLDYLLANATGKGKVRNSFAGLRRFNRFVDSIEAGLGICFSQSDLERAFSVDEFVERIDALRASPKGSLASLKNRERAGAGWTPIVFLNFLLLCIGLGFRSVPAVVVSVLAIAIAASAAFAMFAVRHRRHLARLRQRVEAAEPRSTSLERTREDRGAKL